MIELRLIRYYSNILDEIRIIFYMLNSLQPNTLSEAFDFIRSLDYGTRNIINRARTFTSDFYTIFAQNKELFCMYANNIRQSIHEMCEALDRFDTDVHAKSFWRRDKERHRDRKSTYDMLLKSTINRMKHFSLNVKSIYEHDCSSHEPPGAKQPSNPSSQLKHLEGAGEADNEPDVSSTTPGLMRRNA